MTATRSVKPAILWALVVANVVLATVLVMRMTEGSAIAQARRPADYLMIPAEIGGGASGVVYVLDSTNGTLGGLTLRNNALEKMPPIDLNQIFQVAADRGNKGGSKNSKRD